MHRFLITLLIIVALTPALNAQETEESSWSFNYMMQLAQAEVQSIEGYEQPETNATGTPLAAPWLHLQRFFGDPAVLQHGIRFGIGYVNNGSQALMSGSPIEIRAKAIVVPLQVLFTARPAQEISNNIGLSVAVGPYVSFIVDHDYLTMPGVSIAGSNRVLPDVTSRPRIGLIADLAATWTLSDTRNLSLGYRFMEDQTWFDMADIRWAVGGVFLAIEGPAF